MRKNINELLNQLEEKIPYFESKNKKISSANVAWHIEHSLLVIIKICEAVSASNPDKYKWKFSFWRLLVWLTGSLPRGRAEAPPVVIPGNASDVLSLKKSFDQARQSLNTLKGCHHNQYFFHPIFGKVKRSDTFDFFAIHTNHHLKIIKDILSNK